MKKIMFLLMFVSLISFGQNKPRKVWSEIDKNNCSKDMMVLEDFAKQNSLPPYQFIKCYCDELEKKYLSYYEATNIKPDEKLMMELITPCVSIDFPDFECKEGDCVDGYGKMAFLNEENYEGNFKMALFHGEGTYNYENGSKYEGEFNKNRKHGEGTYFYSDGGAYTGKWQNNLPNGNGLRTWINGETYYGDWKDGYKHGNGSYKYKSGAIHNGEYKNDLPDGPGEYTLYDVKLIGNWVNGKKNGEFIFRVQGEKDQNKKFQNDKEVK